MSNIIKIKQIYLFIITVVLIFRCNIGYCGDKKENELCLIYSKIKNYDYIKIEKAIKDNDQDIFIYTIDAFDIIRTPHNSDKCLDFAILYPISANNDTFNETYNINEELESLIYEYIFRYANNIDVYKNIIKYMMETTGDANEGRGFILAYLFGSNPDLMMRTLSYYQHDKHINYIIDEIVWGIVGGDDRIKTVEDINKVYNIPKKWQKSKILKNIYKSFMKLSAWNTEETRRRMNAGEN